MQRMTTLVPFLLILLFNNCGSGNPQNDTLLNENTTPVSIDEHTTVQKEYIYSVGSSYTGSTQINDSGAVVYVGDIQIALFSNKTAVVNVSGVKLSGAFVGTEWYNHTESWNYSYTITDTTAISTKVMKFSSTADVTIRFMVDLTPTTVPSSIIFYTAVDTNGSFADSDYKAFTLN